MRARTFVFCVFLSLMPITAPASAATFAGGTGEPNDPYQIATAEQLLLLNTDPRLFAKSFILTADIDLDPRLADHTIFSGAVVQWSGRFAYRLGAHTAVIEGYPLGFDGRFDGNDHSIRHCRIYAEADANAGFFLSIGSKGTVCNLRLEDAFVGGAGTDAPSSSTGGSVYRGALAATNAGTIDNCSATGTVIAGASESYAGGLAGRNTGTLNHCSADCEVTAYRAGGLIGINEVSAQVVSCTANGFICGTGAGGLVGSNLGNLQCCKSEGCVLGGAVGGLVCTNGGTVRESHAAATLEALSSDRAYSGGLVCANYETVFQKTWWQHFYGTVVDCYSTSTFTIRRTGSSTLPRALGDGLVAINGLTDPGAVLTSYSLMPSLTKDRSLSSGGGPRSTATVHYVYYLDPKKPEGQTYDPNTYGYGVPLSADEMKAQASFIGWDFDTVWALGAGQESPHLKWEELADDK